MVMHEKIVNVFVSQGPESNAVQLVGTSESVEGSSVAFAFQFLFSFMPSM